VDRVSAERLGETTRLGSYEIIRKLARGGMAELFLARGPRSVDEVFVVKKILPRLAGSPRMTQLFLDEAQLACSLDHPNIVRAFEAGNDGGTAFFAMEYLHGQDLRTVLHRAWTLGEQVPLELAVHIASHVAAALHYAHEQRRPDGTLVEIVHRDVSPSNVVVSYDGAVKLLDFGVAKVATSSVKTRTGTLKGKISYMSPEQAKGSRIDRRSDVFSLGIVLWELVTTQRLFRGENDLQTLQLIINEPLRRPSELQPACPPELERIILRSLARDLSQRYQTAAELLADLEAVARAHRLAADADELSAYLGRQFAPELRSWHEAQGAGRTLLQHLTSVGELTIQLTESDFIEAFDLDAMLAEEDAYGPEDGSDYEQGFDPGEQTELPTQPQPSLSRGGPVHPAPEPRHTPVAPVPAVRPPSVSGGRAATPASPLPVVQPGVSSQPGAPSQLGAPLQPGAPLLPPMPDAFGAFGGPPGEPAGAGAPPGHWAIASGDSSSGAVLGNKMGAPPGPWAIASGSAEVTARAGYPSAPEPVQSAAALAPLPAPDAAGGFALDPALADRLLRRGLWIGAAILAGVVVFAIAMAVAAGP
jgi:serine/threonine protein kinase